MENENNIGEDIGYMKGKIEGIEQAIVAIQSQLGTMGFVNGIIRIYKEAPPLAYAFILIAASFFGITARDMISLWRGSDAIVQPQQSGQVEDMSPTATDLASGAHPASGPHDFIWPQDHTRTTEVVRAGTN